MPADVVQLKSWCAELLELEESYFASDKDTLKKKLGDKIFENLNSVEGQEIQEAEVGDLVFIDSMLVLESTTCHCQVNRD